MSPRSPADPFIPDLRDQGGRLRRAVIAIAVATGLATVALLVTTTLAADDLARPRTGGSYRFVAYFTMGTWILGFLGTRALLVRRARARERELPRAEVRPLT